MSSKKSLFKKIVGQLHLWLGLVSGLVVFVVAITGCIYAFEEEIKYLTQPYQSVTKQHTSYVPPSELKSQAETQLAKVDSGLSEYETQRIYYGSKEESARALFYGKGYYYTLYLDPYSGEVLHTKDMYTDFFTIILYLHYRLLLGDIGEQMVSWSTVVFVIMLITGLILWWPRNKKGASQKLKVKWNARWRRLNYDIHAVLGFYMTWVVIFIALTGLVWAFQWFEDRVYWLSSGGESFPTEYHPHSDTTSVKSGEEAIPIDRAWYKVLGNRPDTVQSGIYFPHSKEDPITIITNPLPGTFYQRSYHYFDRYTLEKLPATHSLRGRYEEAGMADMINRLNYDIHTGAVFGLAGKFIAFFASLIAASLPVTGFLFWLGRMRKKRTSSKRENRNKSVQTNFRTQIVPNKQTSKEKQYDTTSANISSE